jgi:two-component sensor histidine kinase
MLMNELLNSSVKYAIENGKGTISMDVEQLDNEYRIQYRDDDRGMMAGFVKIGKGLMAFMVFT